MPEEPVAPHWERIALDSRRPWSLDDRGRVLRIVTGHVDVFAVRSGAGVERPRHHLFRLESGEIVMDLPGTGGAIDAVGVIAVGGPGAEVLMVPRESIGERAVIEAWIARISSATAEAEALTRARRPDLWASRWQSMSETRHCRLRREHG